MEQQIYCDGIGRISVIEGIVRLDLYSYSPSETDANGQPRPVLSHRVVMGMDGFLRSSEKVVEAVRAISQARQQQGARPAAQPVPQAPAAQAAPRPQAPPPPEPPRAPEPVPPSAPLKPPFP